MSGAFSGNFKAVLGTEREAFLGRLTVPQPNKPLYFTLLTFLDTRFLDI